MDYTIELWTTLGKRHWAECTCGWDQTNTDQHALLAIVNNHRNDHANNGDSAEVI